MTKVTRSGSFPVNPRYQNSIALDDDDQIFNNVGGPKDGSSRDIIGWKNYDEGTKADLSRFTKFETTDAYTYTLSEAHEVFSATKLDYWTREFVYLNPSQDKHYFLTYDRVTTDSANTIKKNNLNVYNPMILDGITGVDGSTYSNINTIQADVGGDPG